MARDAVLLEDNPDEVTITPVQFRQLINERKAEHRQEAREKCQGDLKRIQEMKSKTGVPDPLQLFPKEIWTMLMNQLIPQDKRSVCEVHDGFRNMMGDKLISQVLFPLILDYKVERFWGEPVQEGDADAPPPIRPLAHCPQLRVLCKSLRDQVDQWFENDLISTLHSGVKKAQPSRVVEVSLVNPVGLANLTGMNMDLSDPNSPKPERFYPRSLCFSSGEPTHEVQDYMGWEEMAGMIADNAPAINTFLNHVGGQIWYFCYSFHLPYYPMEGLGIEFAERFTTFLEWLEKMPNIKWLKLKINLDTDKIFEIPPGAILPTLPHLERLDVELDIPNRYMLPVLNAFLKANPQVKILNLVDFRSTMDNGFFVLDSITRRSCALEVLTIDGDRMTGWDDDAWMMQAIKDMHWPLRKLDLQMMLGGKSVYSVFRSLKNFQNLEELSLGIGYCNFRDDVSYLRLQNLKSFQLKLRNDFDEPEIRENDDWKFFFNLQFLIYSKRLETIVWDCKLKKTGWEKLRQDMEGNESREDIINFGCGQGHVDKSNIWKVFPWLTRVKVELSGPVYSDSAFFFMKDYRRGKLISQKVRELTDNEFQPSPPEDEN